MIKDILLISASGIVHIYKICNGVKRLAWTSNNAILPNHKFLLSKLLIDDVAAKIAAIRVYSGAALKSEISITGKNYIDPNEVQYVAQFDEDSFNGNFDKVTLGTSDPDTYGLFSQLTGLDLSKEADEAIEITWNIKIN